MSQDRELRCHCVSPKLQTVTIMGIPFLMCMKCGRALPKPVVERTHTKQELREKYRPKPKPKFDSWEEQLEQIVIETFEEKQQNPKR